MEDTGNPKKRPAPSPAPPATGSEERVLESLMLKLSETINERFDGLERRQRTIENSQRALEERQKRSEKKAHHQQKSKDAPPSNISLSNETLTVPSIPGDEKGEKKGIDGNTPPSAMETAGCSYESLAKKRKSGRAVFGPVSMDEPLQTPAGCLIGKSQVFDDGDVSDIRSVIEEGDGTRRIEPSESDFFIPQNILHEHDGTRKKRVLILCTGGTLTMAKDPSRGGALAPLEGAVAAYMKEMKELNATAMPDVILHEYSPFFDSSDLGPSDWALLANDIKENYLHFDGFVILMGTDTMAYAASALSFMLENLGKPVVVTGSQIPLCEPYNDARRNLIMALIFACRDTITEVSIFFHDRLLRACRATKVNTHRLMAFDSPNLDPLAKIGITIDENEHIVRPPPRGTFRIHTRMDTRILTIRLVPGFDDKMIEHMIEVGAKEQSLRALVLQLYGTGNAPSVKNDFVKILAKAREKGILVVASTQCVTGSVMMGHYATGQALESAGVVPANDMTLEAITCKIAYLYGRGDLSTDEVANLMGVSLRGEITPLEALSPPPLCSTYQRASRKGKKFY